MVATGFSFSNGCFNVKIPGHASYHLRTTGIVSYITVVEQWNNRREWRQNHRSLGVLFLFPGFPKLWYLQFPNSLENNTGMASNLMVWRRQVTMVHIWHRSLVGIYLAAEIGTWTNKPSCLSLCQTLLETNAFILKKLRVCHSRQYPII